MTNIKVLTFSGESHIIIPKDCEIMFLELVQRGSNLWPDAPYQIKEFADIITNGKVLQDYKSQDTSRK